MKNEDNLTSGFEVNC